MILSEKWLRTWVSPRLDTQALAERLTMGGLEVGAVEPASAALAKVVVGEIVAVEPHPRVKNLSVCRVNVGRARPVQVVCGAPNAAAGVKAPTALIGAVLPDGRRLEKVRVGEVVSSGMLCSGAELGLDEDASGLLRLDDGAPVGATLAGYLELDDTLIEIDLTPNRGDCLSIAGVAREVAALTGSPLTEPTIRKVAARSRRRLSIRLEAPADCPRYVGRIIEGVDAQARTPDWMRERLRRSGLRPISPVVDVTNYVMMELGQPMHAFDLERLDRGIIVRRAREGETLTLLDETELVLHPENLVIADHSAAVALAGVMGGLGSAIGAGTRDILLESAFFDPLAVARCARRHGLNTDASHHFERGVSPELQARAVERATRLLLDICGGVPGPVIEANNRRHLPRRSAIALRHARIERVLGVPVPRREVESTLQRLGLSVRKTREGWRATAPAHRFDLAAEHDLVEEVARIHGYDVLPSRAPQTGVSGRVHPEAQVPEARIRGTLIDRDYQEAITYSFVDPQLQALLEPKTRPIRLANPIASNMAVMRLSLAAGLVQALALNYSRQRRRIRLFEIGHAFRPGDAGERESRRVGGVASGPAWPEQWGTPAREVDFYDIKGDVEAVLEWRGPGAAVEFRDGPVPGLHPGRSAFILAGGRRIGWLGQLHPRVQSHVDVGQAVYLFELALDAVQDGRVPVYRAISRFPASRRDLSILVEADVSAERVRRTVTAAAGGALQKFELFDVYRGKGIDSKRKSVAFGLTFQESSRTLTDTEIDGIMSRIISAVQTKLGAELRS